MLTSAHMSKCVMYRNAKGGVVVDHLTKLLFPNKYY